jgi:hypothetical protein
MYDILVFFFILIVLFFLTTQIFFILAIGIDKLLTMDQSIVYFNRCMQLARRVVPAKRRQRAKIFLAATAGMRLLK